MAGKKLTSKQEFIIVFIVNPTISCLSFKNAMKSDKYNFIGFKNPETISLDKKQTIVVDFLQKTIKCKYFVSKKFKQYKSPNK